MRYIREPINSLTHLAGAILSFVGLLALVIKAALNDEPPLTLTSVIIFGISLILLYSASTIYHSVIANERVIQFLRKIDHSMIFILIAGSYTPFCLISLQGVTGWVVFSIVMLLAIAGIIFKMLWFNCPRWLSTSIYIGMGWIIVFAFSPLTKALANRGTMLLISGGIIYTIGGIVYALKPNFLKFKHFGFHEIFHIFIMLGSLAHYLAVFFYVI